MNKYEKIFQKKFNQDNKETEIKKNKIQKLIFYKEKILFLTNYGKILGKGGSLMRKLNRIFLVILQ